MNLAQIKWPAGHSGHVVSETTLKVPTYGFPASRISDFSVLADVSKSFALKKYIRNLTTNYASFIHTMPLPLYLLHSSSIFIFHPKSQLL